MRGAHSRSSGNARKRSALWNSARAPASALDFERAAWLRDRMIAQQFEVEMEFGEPNVLDAVVAAAWRGE